MIGIENVKNACINFFATRKLITLIPQTLFMKPEVISLHLEKYLRIISIFIYHNIYFDKFAVDNLVDN